MSPKKPVDSLGCLCLEAVTQITLFSVKVARIKEIKRYLSEAPQKIREDIFAKVVTSSTTNSHDKWIMYEVFQYTFPWLDCRNVSKAYHQMFLERAKNLLHLNLKGSSINERSLIDALKKLDHLKSLAIPSLASDQTLEEVSKLRHLVLLDISGVNSFTSAGLRLLKITHLEILIIGLERCPNVTSSDDQDIMTEVVTNLPSLREVRTYSYMGDVVLKLQGPTNLEAISIQILDSNVAQSIARKCPRLKKLSMLDPPSCQLQMLQNLKRLRSLRVENLELQYARVNFDSSMRALETLKLARVKGIEVADAAVSLPNLEVLELIECDVPKDLVLSILKGCRRLRRVAMSNDVGLTDKDLLSICKGDSLKNLEQLWLTRARHLSSDSVVLLMNHCDKLVLIGTLNGWNVEKVETNYLSWKKSPQ
ncbi:uncharacterized protein LOC132702333 [Cylas formicarius]|uniref:uncharacterized protein LOC132702333 n=1 Tax=Cylas formicarius TaxID=197179 RepID=UPI002958893E|nr:uncharacterized protein LOC132702333 [Cylas formicarius]